MKTTGLIFIKVFLSITLSHSIDMLKGFIIALPQKSHYCLSDMGAANRERV